MPLGPGLDGPSLLGEGKCRFVSADACTRAAADRLRAADRPSAPGRDRQPLRLGDGPRWRAGAEAMRRRHLSKP